jgi:hypothetical protein
MEDLREGGLHYPTGCGFRYESVFENDDASSTNPRRNPMAKASKETRRKKVIEVLNKARAMELQAITST